MGFSAGASQGIGRAIANFMTGETVYVSGGPRVANREESAR